MIPFQLTLSVAISTVTCEMTFGIDVTVVFGEFYLANEALGHDASMAWKKKNRKTFSLEVAYPRDAGDLRRSVPRGV